jgi:hypothetical protein
MRYEKLHTGQKIELDPETILGRIEGWPPKELQQSDPGIEAAAIAVVSRRKADNQRFVDIEPFTLGHDDGSTFVFPMYASSSTAASGPPELMVGLIKQIEETERVYFRAKER